MALIDPGTMEIPEEFRPEDAPFVVWQGKPSADGARSNSDYPLLEVHFDNGEWRVLKMFRRPTGNETASIELPTEVLGGESFETGAAAFERACELLPDDPHYSSAPADPEDSSTPNDGECSQNDRTTIAAEQSALTNW